MTLNSWTFSQCYWFDCYWFIFHSSLPFDWRNPIGYLFGFAFQATSAFYIAFAGPYHTSFIAGTCLMSISLAEDLKKHLLCVNDLAKHRKTRSKLLKKMSNSVQFHSNCKQLSSIRKFNSSSHMKPYDWFSRLIDDFTDVYELIFLAFFGWSYLSICGTTLMIHYELVTFLYIYARIIHLNSIIILFILVSTFAKYNNIGNCIVRGILGFCFYCIFLRVWSSCIQCIRRFKFGYRSIRLVSISNWDSKDATTSYGGLSTSN